MFDTLQYTVVALSDVQPNKVNVYSNIIKHVLFERKQHAKLCAYFFFFATAVIQRNHKHVKTRVNQLNTK